jgi:hypothetical protein
VWATTALVVASVAACAPARTPDTGSTTTVTPGWTGPVVPPAPSAAGAPTAGDSPPTSSALEVLASLVIDDQPVSDAGYRREEWPHWRDIDGDGCDARQQALIAGSRTRAQVDVPCTVRAGDWVSDYDGATTDDPGDLDVDHVVPLENAYMSGAWQWSTDQRTAFANDQSALWAVSAASNRSKGSRAPDEWRPPNRAIWCRYARRWTAIKVRWGLTATTAERDALGQMLDTCPPGDDGG